MTSPTGQLTLASTCGDVPAKSIGELVAGDRDAHADRDRLGLVADAVDDPSTYVTAVRKRGDLAPHQALGGRCSSSM